MANTKISDLNALTSLASVDLVPVVDTSEAETKYITKTNLITTLGIGGSVDTSGVPIANDIARFTDADTIEGRSYAELLVSLSGQAGADFNIPNNIAITYGDAGEKVEGDGTDLTITSSNLLNLTATTDVVVPVSVGLIFGDGAEKVESNNTDLTINSGVDINLTATGDVNIPANVGVTFGDDGEKIEGNGTNLTISGNNINLTAVADVIVPANVGVTFGTGEKIEGNNTDLTVTSGGAINLTATTDVVVPANVGVTFGTGEKIEGNNTDLTITSGADIALTATDDVNIPANVGITFGDDAEKIEGDGTDLTIIGNNINLTPTVSVVLGGDLDLGQNTIIQDPTPTGDHTFNGPSFTGTSGMALALFDVCILQADGKYDKGDGDAEVTTKGMCVLTAETFAGDASTGVMILPGSFVRDDTFAYTVGATLYLPLTAGPPPETIPPAAGDFVRVMGYAHSARDIFFNPSPDYLERV